MPIGIILSEWDNEYGPKITNKIPNDFEFSMVEINKILMTHSISKDTDPELLEIRANNQLFLSYCPKDKIPEIGYSMLVLILSTEEKIKESMRDELIKVASDIYANPSKTNALFEKYGESLFQKHASKKILFIGNSAVGKTSIKKYFFEGTSSETLLLNPLEPTYGLVQFNYDWFDIDLGIADLAGQEIEYYLNKPNENDIDPFDSVDCVLYIFDPSYWEDNSDYIVDHLAKIHNILDTKAISSSIFIFCHKIDLIEEELQQRFKDEIFSRFPNKFHPNIHFTSIIPPMEYTLNRSMQQIIGNLSIQTTNLQTIFEKTLQSISKTAIVLLNQNKFELENYTKDFLNLNFQQLYSLLENVSYFSNIYHDTTKEFALEGENLNLLYSALDPAKTAEKIVLLSFTLSIDELKTLKAQLIHNISETNPFFPQEPFQRINKSEIQ